LSKVTLDLRQPQQRFDDAFAKLVASSRKSAKDLFLQQARGVARNVFTVTPPMGGTNPSVKLNKPGSEGRGIRVDWKAGLDAGRARINSDLKRALKPIGAKTWERMLANNQVDPAQGNLSSLLAWYKSIQNARRRPSAAKKPTPTPLVSALRKALYARQGATPAGWLEAASRLGVKGIPRWITRHPSKGSIALDVAADVFFMEAINLTSHQSSKAITLRMGSAIAMQARLIERWLKNTAEKRRLTR
jgi:hypothetical protein